MALTRITKGVIKPNENYDTHNINSTGIITAVGANFTGNVSVGGVLTYEDVTSIDSVGIITAQSDIHVGGGVSAVGVGTFGGLDIGGDIDVDGHTNLDNVSIAGITTMTGNLHIANSQPSIYLNDLDSENDYSLINNNGAFAIRDNDRGVNAYELLANGTNKFNGLVNIVNGLNIDADLDVDGHTNLDNVNIAGVTTITDDVTTEKNILTLVGTSWGDEEKVFTTYKRGSVHLGRFGVEADGAGQAGQLIFECGSGGSPVERLRINSGGSVGIGTDNPSARLHLHKASGDTIQKIESSNGAASLELRHTNGYGYINYRQDGAETFRVGQIAQFTSYSVYNPNSSLPYQLCVEGNGEVGINTHNPVGTLHLLRNSANHGITLQRGGTNAGTAYVQVHSNGVLSLQGGNNIHYVSGGSQQHIWYRGATEIARFNTTGSLGIGTATVRNNRAMQLTGESNSLFLITGHAPSICLNRDPDDSSDADRSFFGVSSVSNGFANGTAAGDTILRGNSSGKIHFAIGTAIKMHLTSAGDLNIGTVGRFDSSGIVKTAHGTESAPSHTFLNDPDNGMYRPTTNTLGFVTGGSERLRISSTGKVSIGNESSPLGTLHVKEGDSGVTSADTSQDTLFLESSGNAGLTIATPNANTGYLTFADPDDSNVGQIIYRHGGSYANSM